MNKTFIFENKTFGFENKSSVFKNKSFIYSFSQALVRFREREKNEKGVKASVYKKQ